MKKKMIVLIISLLVFLVSSTNVSANSGPPVIGITVTIDVCTYDENLETESFEGNIDILVRKEDLGVTNFTSMNEKFKSSYPFYEDIEYFDSIPSGWASFSAHYIDEEEWRPYKYGCGMSFGDYQLVDQMKSIIVVYFLDDGKTVLMSDEIEVPNVLFYQDMDSLIYIETEANTIHSFMNPHFNGYFILTSIAIFVLMIFSIVIELIVASFFGLKNSKAMINILLVNFVTQLLMFIYFFVIFNQYQRNYTLHLFAYEILVLIVEFAYLYWRLKDQISWKKLIVYVLIANLISYFAGFIRYM